MSYITWLDINHGENNFLPTQWNSEASVRVSSCDYVSAANFKFCAIEKKNPSLISFCLLEPESGMSWLFENTGNEALFETVRQYEVPQDLPV